MGFGGGDPNLYGYAGNDPINVTDPGGELPAALVAIAGLCFEGGAWGVGMGLIEDLLTGRKITWQGIGRDALIGCLTNLVTGGGGWLIRRIPGLGNLAERLLLAACGLNSFVGDTVVATPEGERAISSLHVGDHVLAYDEATGKVGSHKVTAVVVNADPTVKWLSIDGEAVETTREHPFFTTERGWVEAGRLWVGAHVRTANGQTGTVQQMAVGEGPARMYNLEVEGAHTFFVGHQQLLVHNCAASGFSIRSVIKNNPYAKRLAGELSAQGQRDVDHLVAQLAAGNANAGISTRALGNGFLELRGSHGGRVIVKQTGSGQYDIVGKFQGHARGDAENSRIILNLIEGYSP